MVHLRRAAVLLLVLALALAVGGSLAGAKKHKKKKKGGTWASQITLTHPTGTQFEGTVSSKLAACRNQRYVIVFYVEPTTGQILPFSVQRTDSNGYYAVNLTRVAYDGQYFAQVSEERIKAKKKPQKCQFAQSPSVTITG